MSTPRCDWCGLFCRVADQYTHFCSGEDIEPPDPILLCESCSRAVENEIVAKTKRPAAPYVPWQLGRCHRRAVSRLGMVLAGPKGAAWCEAYWPDKIPEGHRVWENTT